MKMEQIENEATNGFAGLRAKIDAIEGASADAEELRRPITDASGAYALLLNEIDRTARAAERRYQGYGSMVEAAQREALASVPLHGFYEPASRGAAESRARKRVAEEAQGRAVAETVDERAEKLAARARDCVDAVVVLKRAYESAHAEATGPNALLEGLTASSLHAEGVVEAWYRSRPKPMSEVRSRWMGHVQREELENVITLERIALPLINEFCDQTVGQLKAKRYGSIPEAILETERGVAFRLRDLFNERQRRSLPRKLTIAANAINALLELHAVILGQHGAFMSGADFQRLLDGSLVPADPLAVDPRWAFRFIPPSPFSAWRQA